MRTKETSNARLTLAAGCLIATAVLVIPVAPGVASRSSIVAPDFVVRVRPGSDTVGAGDASYREVEVERAPYSRPFAQPVTLSVQGLPPGTGATFSLNSWTPWFDSNLYIQTDTAMARGAYDMTLAATGGGKSHEVPIRLTVKERTHITCTASRTTLLYGETCRITGVLTSDETALPGRVLFLQTRAVRSGNLVGRLPRHPDFLSWTSVLSATAGAEGLASFRARPSRNRFYRVRYREDPVYADFNSDSVYVQVRPRVFASTEYKQVWVGQLDRVRTAVAPGHPGQRLSVQLKTAEGWKNITTVRLNSSSRATWRWRPSVAGTRRLRMVLPEHNAHVTGHSRIFEVLVVE